MTLKRLSEKELAKLSDDLVLMLKVIMPEIFKVDEETSLTLWQCLTTESWDMSQFYAECGDFDAAIRTAGRVADVHDKSKALTRIAELQTESGNFDVQYGQLEE